MTMQRLRKELSNTHQSLRRLLFADEPFGRSEDVTKIRVSDWYRYQNRCIDAVSAGVKDLFADAKVSKSYGNDLALFVMGSVARLEFLPGDSDLDFLAVLGRDGPDEDASRNGFSDFEKRLIQHIGKRATKIMGEFALDVKVDGVPSPRGKVFYTKSSLFGEIIGKECEPSWAVIERYSLLFESVYFGKSESFSTELRKLANDCYCLNDDVRRDYFPALCSSLVYALMFSGIMAKVAHLRKTAPMPEADQVIFKTLFSRIWGPAVNLIVLHFIYWRRLFDRQWSITDEDIGSCVRGSTINKIVETIPTLVSVLRKTEGKWLEVHCEKREAAMRAVERFKKMEGLLRCSGADGDLTLLGSYLTMMTLADNVRRGKEPLNKEVVESIRDADRKLRELVGLVETQTWEVITSRQSEYPSAYFRLVEVIGRHMFRSAFDENPEMN